MLAPLVSAFVVLGATLQTSATTTAATDGGIAATAVLDSLQFRQTGAATHTAVEGFKATRTRYVVRLGLDAPGRLSVRGTCGANCKAVAFEADGGVGGSLAPGEDSQLLDVAARGNTTVNVTATGDAGPPTRYSIEFVRSELEGRGFAMVVR